MPASFLPSASQAQSMLTPVRTDQSVGILNHLFGTTNWHDLYMQSIGFSASSASAFFPILSAFDDVVFAFVTLWVVYIMTLAVVNTAHSGKTMGDRFHTLYTPLRSAIAMVMLAPIPGIGISAIQAVLLGFVWVSIGGANYLANTATSYMARHGGMLTALAPSGGTRLAQGLLQSLVTREYIHNFESPNPGSAVPVFAPGSPTWTAAGSGGEWTYTFSNPATGGFAPGQLGQIVISCRAQSGPMCTAQKAAVMQMAQTLAPYAEAVVRAAQGTVGGQTAAPVTVPASPLYVAAKQYDAAVAGAISAEQSQISPQFAQSMDNLNAHVHTYGWLSLGAYYWTIARSNSELQDRVDETPGWTGYDGKAVAADLGPFDSQRLDGVLTQVAAGAQAVAPPAAKPSGSVIMSALDELIPSNLQTLFAQPAADFLLNGDPVANLQRAGQIVLDGELGGILANYVGARVAAKSVDSATAGIPLVGKLISGADGVPARILRYLSPYVVTFLLALTLIAFVWAFYIPSIPFILWVFGVLGWLMLVVESLVASVLWASGIATPEGEGLLGERGSQGFMLFLNVMFRPALMVIGFFASFLLLTTIGNWVGAGFVTFWGQENASAWISWNPLMWIGSVMLVTYLAMELAHKVFELITWIPENVMRWVGGQGAQLGEQKHAQSIEAGFVAASKARGSQRDAMREIKRKGGEERGGSATKKTADAEAQSTQKALDTGEKSERGEE